MTFSAGAGTIAYSANSSTPLVAVGQNPDCLGGNTLTGEASNCYYGQMSSQGGASLQQKFGVNTSLPA